MFETAEIGRKVTKGDFEALLPDLRTQLLEAQRQLRSAGVSVAIIISGVEGAGRSEVINRLTEWLDPRGVHTFAFWDESDEERERPHQWRFWRVLPPKGRIHLLYGSWYTQPIIAHALGELDAAGFDEELRAIEALERMLAENGTMVVKFWYHLAKNKQMRRLRKKEVAWAQRGKEVRAARAEQARRFHELYDSFTRVATRALRVTDTGACAWHVVEATNKRYRDLTTGQTLLDMMRRRLAGDQVRAQPVVVHSDPISSRTVLDSVDLERDTKYEDYKTRLPALQLELSKKAWEARTCRRSLIAVFEGWDAAGKGSAIRRFTAALDARLFRVVPIAAPTDEELAHHYLWRFWRHVPRGGHVTIFDRSWYGRVLVERVEGFATDEEWMRAFGEINEFEDQLTRGGIGLAKFWIHISKDEQLRRFEERQTVPWKNYKITDEDWRNRDKWDAYKLAVNDMVARTSSTTAPWTLVSGNDKKTARLQILETLSRTFDRIL